MQKLVSKKHVSSHKEHYTRNFNQLINTEKTRTERYNGRLLGCILTLSYANRDAGARHWVYHKAMGIITRKDGQRHLHMVMFKGLSDPVSLFALMLFSHTVATIVAENVHVPVSLPLTPVGIALLVTAVVAAATFAEAALSQKGKAGKRKLLAALDAATAAHDTPPPPC